MGCQGVLGSVVLAAMAYVELRRDECKLLPASCLLSSFLSTRFILTRISTASSTNSAQRSNAPASVLFIIFPASRWM